MKRKQSRKKKSNYSKLKSEYKKKKVTVREVSPRKLKDYAGMNDEAAKKLGYPKMPNKTIHIDKSLPSKTKPRALKHEYIEMKLMEKGMPYWKAHKIALEKEKSKR